MNRSHAVARPFRDRIGDFVKGVYPGELGRHATATRRAALPADVPNVMEAAELQDYIRQLRAKKLNQPDPTRAWQVGGALIRLTGKAWLNPMVMLYVMGHYDCFADVATRVVAKGTIESPTLAEMVRLLPGLVAFKGDPQMDFSRVKDQLAVAEAKAWAKAMGPTDPVEIRLWSIDPPMYAAFAEAWRARAVEPSPAGAAGVVAACGLIAQYATYSVEERDRQVAAILSEWLSR